MAGNKRPHDKMASDTTQNNSPYATVFDHFRTELDEHHDRRERVMKASKDITAASKKIIFSLQRVKQLGQPILDKRIIGDVAKLSQTINDLFQGIGKDLQGLDGYRYQRNISGGIQEFMEAIMFQHYIENQTVISHIDAAAKIPGNIMLTYEDYALGLFDMTGELMRFAITSLAASGQTAGPATRKILADMQTLRSELELLDAAGSYGLARDFESKLKVTRQSVEKVENAFYSMTVRGKERPPGWTPDTSASREAEIETY